MRDASVRAAAEKSDNPWLLKVHGILELRAGRHEQAVATFRRAAAVLPDDKKLQAFVKRAGKGPSFSDFKACSGSPVFREISVSIRVALPAYSVRGYFLRNSWSVILYFISSSKVGS